MRTRTPHGFRARKLAPQPADDGNTRKFTFQPSEFHADQATPTPVDGATPSQVGDVTPLLVGDVTPSLVEVRGAQATNLEAPHASDVGNQPLRRTCRPIRTARRRRWTRSSGFGMAIARSPAAKPRRGQSISIMSPSTTTSTPTVVAAQIRWASTENAASIIC